MNIFLLSFSYKHYFIKHSFIAILYFFPCTIGGKNTIEEKSKCTSLISFYKYTNFLQKHNLIHDNKKQHSKKFKSKPKISELDLNIHS